MSIKNTTDFAANIQEIEMEVLTNDCSIIIIDSVPDFLQVHESSEEVPQITIHLPFSELSLAVANQILASGLLLCDTSGIFDKFLVTIELGTRCRSFNASNIWNDPLNKSLPHVVDTANDIARDMQEAHKAIRNFKSTQSPLN